MNYNFFSEGNADTANEDSIFNSVELNFLNEYSSNKSLK